MNVLWDWKCSHISDLNSKILKLSSFGQDVIMIIANTYFLLHRCYKYPQQTQGL